MCCITLRYVITKKTLTKIRRKFSKISLIVIKYSAGKLRMSKPCGACINSMRALGFKDIYYTDEDGNITVEKIRDIESTHISFLQKYNPHMR
jgi:cytidine deaminase